MILELFRYMYYRIAHALSHAKDSWTRLHHTWMEMYGNGRRTGMVHTVANLKQIPQALHPDLAKYIAEDVGITILNIVVCLVFDILILQSLGVPVRAFDSHCNRITPLITWLLDDNHLLGCPLNYFSTSLLSTKNLNLAKCRLVDFIKGSISMLFFAKYLTISKIAISNPLTLLFSITNRNPII